MILNILKIKTIMNHLHDNRSKLLFDFMMKLFLIVL